MEEAFGASLVGSHDNGCDDLWYKRWKRVVVGHNRLYEVPGGTVGCHFLVLLVSSITERYVKKGSDVPRLLTRRMSMWKSDCFDDLLVEAEQCTRKFGRLSESKSDKASSFSCAVDNQMCFKWSFVPNIDGA